MRYTKRDVKHELALAKRRLKTFAEHTGFTYEIDEDYFLNMASRKKGVSQLRLIKWQNVNKKNIKFNALKVSSVNKLHGNIKTTELTNNEAEQFIKDIKKAEKVTGEKTKVMIYSREAIPAAKKYIAKRTDAKEWEEYKSVRNEKALNNYYNNVKTMGDATADPALKLVSEIIKNKIKDGELTASILNKSNLYKISGINLFDSDQGDTPIESSASHILAVLREEIPITDQEIYDLGHMYGMSDKDIEEIL